jgi:peptide/nickel transport system substrate-binding protein
VSRDATNGGVACVDGVEIVFASDTDAQVNALRAQEADIIFAQPQTAFIELAESPDFEVESIAGPTYEHWSFNLRNEHLSDPAVREAIAYGIDKGEVVSTLYSPLFGDLLPEAGLGQTYWMTNQPPYVDFQEQYDGAQPDAAEEALEGAGYDCSGEVCTHPDRGDLTLRVGTTGGNRLREDQQQLIQAQLAGIGIDVEIDNVQGSAYFTERPFSEGSVACYTGAEEGADCNIWDIAQFAWVGGPWPGSGHSTYQTEGGNNIHSFSDPAFDARVTECDATIDDDERADCYNELAEWVVTLEMNPEDGLVVVPLTQKPQFYAYSTIRLDSGAVSPDMQNTGPLTNVADYIVAS